MLSVALGTLGCSKGQTHRVCIADLFDFPLPITRVAQQGNGPIRAPTGQDQSIVVWCPADRIHWEGQDRPDYSTGTT